MPGPGATRPERGGAGVYDVAPPPITVADALCLPALRRGLPAVVAGAHALDRRIRWVHAGEVPNMASLLQGGELLLTTGMGVGERGADQRRFASELAARGVAALVIELGTRFRTRLPPALVAAAERHELPLVELHAAVPFVAITQAIHTEIVNDRYDLLRRANDLQDRFTAAMLQGDGIPGVLSVLAEAVANPVYLERGDGRLLAYALPPGMPDKDPLAPWTHAARDAAVLGIAAELAGHDRSAPARLVSLPVEAPLDAFARLAVERAATIVALGLLRIRQEDELLAHTRGDFLSRLAHGRLSPDVAAHRARVLGFTSRPAGRLLPLTARLSDGPRAWDVALHELDRSLATLGAPWLVGIDPADDCLLLVLGLPAATDRPAMAARAASVLRATAQRHVGSDVIVAAGPAGDWEVLGLGLQQAAEASAAARRLPGRTWHDAAAMPLDRLLWRLRDDHEVGRYVDQVLAPVLAHDTRGKHPLFPTLEALCEHGGHKARTARALHLNRQALYDRIARLEQLLGADLSDAGTMLTLQLAIRARRHAGSLADPGETPCRVDAPNLRRVAG